MATPHIAAEKGDFAKTVLMPGDPLRAKFIAETYLENPVLVNNIRGIQGYTGTYKGTKVSVMASGMGMPSIGIYSYELYHFFGVEAIVRIGSAGALRPEVKLRDLVFGMGACTNSAYAKQFGLGDGSAAPICDFELLSEAVAIAKTRGLSYHVGNLLSSDTFYSADAGETDRYAALGTLAVEMEAAALYLNAAAAGKRALAVCTVSDSLVTGEATTSEERQNTFCEMIELSLSLAKKFS